MRLKTLSLLVGLALAVSGCGKVVNPYKGEFECPQAEKGKCAGLEDSYLESLKQDKSPDYITKLEEQALKEAKKAQQNATQQLTNYYPKLDEDQGSLSIREVSGVPEIVSNQYLEEMFKKLNKMLREPKTPMITPPRIARLLILPYVDPKGEEFYFARYIYFMVDPPKWVFQNIFITPFPIEGEEEKSSASTTLESVKEPTSEPTKSTEEKPTETKPETETCPFPGKPCPEKENPSQAVPGQYLKYLPKDDQNLPNSLERGSENE